MQTVKLLSQEGEKHVSNAKFHTCAFREVKKNQQQPFSQIWAAVAQW